MSPTNGDIPFFVFNNLVFEKSSSEREALIVVVARLGEDAIKPFNQNTSRTVAKYITWTLYLLRRKNKRNNIRTLREDTGADRNSIFSLLSLTYFHEQALPLTILLIRGNK